MPIISTFFGIHVRMYFADHGPPHMHVEYQGQEALIDITSGQVLAGSLEPGQSVRLSEGCFARVGPTIPQPGTRIENRGVSDL